MLRLINILKWYISVLGMTPDLSDVGLSFEELWVQAALRRA